MTFKSELTLLFFIVSKGGLKKKYSKTKKGRRSAAKCAHRPFGAFPLLEKIQLTKSDLKRTRG